MALKTEVVYDVVRVVFSCHVKILLFHCDLKLTPPPLPFSADRLPKQAEEESRARFSPLIVIENSGNFNIHLFTVCTSVVQSFRKSYRNLDPFIAPRSKTPQEAPPEQKPRKARAIFYSYRVPTVVCD